MTLSLKLERLEDGETAEAPQVSVVVPLLDEEESLRELADAIREACSELTFEVLFVDDGSKDHSWKTITAIHAEDARFGGLRFRMNYGKSAALAAGFESARGEYVVTMDADLQDDPAEIPEMIRTLEAGADLVSGWKRKRQDPVSKKIPSRFFNAITRTLSGIPLHDFNCGLKAYRSEVAKSVRVYGELHRYIPLLAKWEGYDRIAEQEVKHHPRIHGTTKFGLERYLRGFLDLLSVLFLTRFAARPMHFFGTLGSLLQRVQANRLGRQLGQAAGQPIGDRPLLLFGVLLILVGVQMFTTGLLGQIMVRPAMEDTSGLAITDRLQTDALGE